jgi:hypothetical protein
MIILDAITGIETPAITINGNPSTVLLTTTIEGSNSTSEWAQANISDPWIATKTVNGILATDAPIVDINLSAVAFADVENVQSDWALVYRVESSSDNEINFYALDEPTQNLTVQIQVVR